MIATLPIHSADAQEATVRLVRPRQPNSLPSLKKVATWLVIVLIALAAVVLLWFLYEKTQATNPAARASVEAKLRQIRQLDSDWNVDILRSKVGLNESYDAIVAPLQKINGVINLLTDAQGASTPAVAGKIEAVRQVFLQKGDVVDQFKSHNSILRNSLRYLPTAATEAHAALAGEKSTGKPGSVTIKLTDLDISLSGTLGEALKYAIVTDENQRNLLMLSAQKLELVANELASGSAGKEAIAVFLNHALTILRQKSNEQALLAGIAAVPTVSVIDSTAASFDDLFAAQSTDSEFWRSALFGYAAFLLVLVAFIGWRLRRSYLEINSANASLVWFNEKLEQRVHERTKELGNALTSLRESEVQLVQSEKMSSLGQMIAGVAHEINTPLAYVRSSLETVGDQLNEVDNLVHHSASMIAQMTAIEPDPEQLAQCFAALSALTDSFSDNAIVQELRKLSTDGLYGIDQISEIVINLRNFSRLDRSKTTLFDVREGLDSTLVIARNTVKHHELLKHYADIPQIECAPSQLNQVFLNLITNAAQALPQQGGKITLSTSLEGERIRIDIADNGSGIAPENLEKIFDPFFTTKEIGKGTGLGLSIVYKIIQEHSGTIQVHSVQGQGTSFSIHLPIRTVTSAQITPQ